MAATNSSASLPRPNMRMPLAISSSAGGKGILTLALLRNPPGTPSLLIAVVAPEVSAPLMPRAASWLVSWDRSRAASGAAAKQPHIGSHFTSAQVLITERAYAVERSRGPVQRELFLRGDDAPSREEYIECSADTEVEHAHTSLVEMVTASFEQGVHVPAISSAVPSEKVDSSGQTGQAGLEFQRVKKKLGRDRLALPPLRLPLAFTLAHRVVAEEIDEYAHVNNAVYLQWLDRIAWTHSAKLGMTLADCLSLRRGMAVRHSRIDYLEAAVAEDELLLATWLVACDGRLRCTRRFEIVRISDNKRVAEAEIEYFCLNLDSGK